MFVEGKLIETGLEVVAKKLVDIFGDRVGVFLKKDKSRAASYRAYYALRRIEEAFRTLENLLETDDFWRVLNPQELDYSPGVWMQKRVAIGHLSENLNILSEQLADLTKAFSEFSDKMEIFHSLQDAENIRIYIGMDDDVLRALFDYENDRGYDMPSLVKHMKEASAQARAAVASFVKNNYKVDQREDGR